MKKFLSLVLALVMTMSLVTVSAGAKDFTDSSKIQYAEAVDVMSAAKVIDGYTDGTFNPTATLTRGAAAKIICNLILGPTTASALVADAAPYKLSLIHIFWEVLGEKAVVARLRAAFFRGQRRRIWRTQFVTAA